jgi:hypothetical protein
MNTPLQLLKDKRSSAVIDARTIEINLARLNNESAEATTRIKFAMRSVEGMFHDYIATLDESIHDIECVMRVSKPMLLLSQSSAGLV